jgi:ATP-dependent helicase/DNAse subunit B
MAENSSPATLLLAPVGAGKTETAITRLLDTITDQPFANVWVLLASERQIHNFRDRMIAQRPERRVFFNVEFFNFYTLYEHLLEIAGKPQRCLSEPARLSLLRHMLVEMKTAGELPVFGEIAETPGFTRVAANFIFELKQNTFHPEDFTALAQTPKDAELARIYDAYQAQLQQHDLVDREGEGWLALDEIQAQPDLCRDVDLLIVDGYDQFTISQARLLALLASRAGQTLMTLTTVPGRDQTIGRRFNRARERLYQTFKDEGQALSVEHINYAVEDRHPALRHLVENIFQQDAKQTEAKDIVDFIEAPAVTDEVGAVLRRVKALLLAGCQPDEIVIALRDWGRYAPYVTALADEYGLNRLLALQYNEPLLENPAIVALLDLLDLWTHDFRRRNLLDVLRSPYFAVTDLSALDVDLLDRVSQVLRVTGGKDEWLQAIDHATKPQRNPDEDDPDESGDKLLTAETAVRLKAALEGFFTAVTPAPQDTATGYIEWLETLIGLDPEHDPDDDPATVNPSGYTLNMIEQIRKPAKTGVIERDLAALHQFKRTLLSMVGTEGLFEALSIQRQVDWKVWLTDLQNVLTNEVVDRAPGRHGRVLVTTVTDARGLPHSHVFIPGLAEGIFPGKISEDPLYLDSERRARQQLGIPLLTQAERADDDGLFYELISLARESLTLSRPYIQDGDSWAESHLWRGVARVFNDADTIIKKGRLRIGAVVKASEVATMGEAALAVADGFNHGDVPADIEAVYGWLLRAQSNYWNQIQHGRAVESGRLSNQPHDRYSGHLSHPDMIERAARLLDENRTWSASQINEYGTCGFRFFARRLLHLEAFEEPEDGMDSLIAGTLHHEILEEAYRWFISRKIEIKPENIDRALEFLRAVADDLLADAPQRLGFQESALWEQDQHMIRRRLEQFVRLDFSGESPVDKHFSKGEPRTIYRIEAPFGISEDDALLELELDDGSKMRVRGKIDRIDRYGDTAVVIDYKTGSSKIDLKELSEGRNFQMMLYLLAAQHILANDPETPPNLAGGMFWHLNSGRLLGSLRFDDDGNEAIDKARAHLTRYLELARQGDFTVEPNKLDERRCVRYCEYHHLCRVSITHKRKHAAQSAT